MELKSFHEKDEITTEIVTLLIAAKINSEPESTARGFS